MAEVVADAIEAGGCYLLEAGTGVGKSLAYLLPCIGSGMKTIVSTATIALQDQLLLRDVPAAAGALGIDLKAAVLKGRKNYVCMRKWEQRVPGLGLDSALQVWVGRTETGDLSEAPVSLDRKTRRMICSDRTDCLGGSCPYKGKCFYLAARAEAQRAGLVVLNHHLLLTGLLGEDILPQADVLVADEAHRLDDAAAECLGLSLAGEQLIPVTDEVAFSELSAEDKEEILGRVRVLISDLSDLMAGCEETSAWAADDHRESLDNAGRHAGELADRLDLSGSLPAASRVALEMENAVDVVRHLDPTEWCTYVEVSGGRKTLRAVPLELGDRIDEVVYSCFSSVILTSGTLTVAGSFEYFAGRLGAAGAYTESFGSPFDYAGQGVMTVPDGLPHPDRHDELASAVWASARTLSQTVGGRTMILFTSYRNLNLVKRMARKNLPEGMELLAQGDRSRTRLLNEFRRSSSTILLGTASFWEGVDLPGSILQVLVIDRIPFPSPGHPLVRARMDLIEGRGGSSFMEYTLPLAVVRLRQGMGRLIRSSEDRGVVVLTDRRLLTASYGPVILDSMPALRKASFREAVEFASTECRNEAEE
jgi:ATP-dependent DNA helicase DinG